MTQSPHPRKSGCLGCLTRIILALAFGLVVVILVTAIIAPWAFDMGGHFHPLADWQGWGVIHAPASGGDYVIYVHILPWLHGTGGSVSRGANHITGSVLLCTPRNERFTLNLGGDFEKGMYISSDGKRAHLYMYNRSGLARQFGFDMRRRPSFELYGAWHNPDLVLDDRGTFSLNFQADGTLSPANAHRTKGQPVEVTLREGSASEFDAACAKK
jgi:hypothetical protein